jgi:hypothetical protein
MNTVAFKLLECLIAAMRDLANEFQQGTEEADTFHDAADALDDALALLEDLYA